VSKRASVSKNEAETVTDKLNENKQMDTQIKYEQIKVTSILISKSKNTYYNIQKFIYLYIRRLGYIFVFLK
jgi:hypothetical protein